MKYKRRTYRKMPRFRPCDVVVDTREKVTHFVANVGSRIRNAKTVCGIEFSRTKYGRFTSAPRNADEREFLKDCRRACPECMRRIGASRMNDEIKKTEPAPPPDEAGPCAACNSYFCDHRPTPPPSVAPEVTTYDVGPDSGLELANPRAATAQEIVDALNKKHGAGTVRLIGPSTIETASGAIALEQSVTINFTRATFDGDETSAPETERQPEDEASRRAAYTEMLAALMNVDRDPDGDEAHARALAAARAIVELAES